MGAFGSILGGVMTVSSLAIGFFTVWTFTEGYWPLLWFVIFGLLGGWALGALNSQKARTQDKYKNEYTAYVGMFIAAILTLGTYYLLFAIDKIDAKIPNGGMDANKVVFLAISGAFIGLFGFGLTIANMLVENTRRY